MWTSLVAVVGTLAGGLLVGWLQSRAARTARREARRDTHRREALDAVTALASALADHRRAMVALEDLRLSNPDHPDVETARDETHRTRSAITGPLFQVGVLTPELAAVAEQATQATYALRNAPDEETLQALRGQAKAAAERLTAAAHGVFAIKGGGRGTLTLVL